MSRCFFSCLLGFKVVRFLHTALKEVSLSVLLGFSEAGMLWKRDSHVWFDSSSCVGGCVKNFSHRSESCHVVFLIVMCVQGFVLLLRLTPHVTKWANISVDVARSSIFMFSNCSR